MIETTLAIVLILTAVLAVMWRAADREAGQLSARIRRLTADRDRLTAHARHLEVRERHLREQVARYRRELDAIAGPERPVSVTEWAGALAEIEAATSPEDFR